MNTFMLKTVAAVCMLFDHVWEILPLPIELKFFKSVGRIAFPIYAYMIAQGWNHSKNTNKYLVRLGAFALISEIPFDFAFNLKESHLLDINLVDETNVFYTLFLGAICIAIYKSVIKTQHILVVFLTLLIIPCSFLISFVFRNSMYLLELGFSIYTITLFFLGARLPKREDRFKVSLPRKAIAVILIIPIIMSGTLMDTDYGAYGIVFIFLLYINKPENRISRTITMTFCVFLLYGYPYLYYMVVEQYGVNLFRLPGINMYNLNDLTYFYFSMIAAVLVFMYNNRKGYNIKWIFYIFYPFHICVIASIRYIIDRYNC